MSPQPGPLRMIVVGLGHQSVDDHIPAIQASDALELVGVVDIDSAKAADVGRQHHVLWGSTVEELLDALSADPDAALIAVPHAGYLTIVQTLAGRGIHIIKEKPFAISFDDAVALKRVVQESGVTLQVTLQRRFNPIYLSFQQLVKRIGKIHSIEARYTMNVARLDEGWRASRLYAGGGALIDLGYHYIDLIVWYFGLPDSVTCQLSTGNRDGQIYDVEDTALLQFSYGSEVDESIAVMGSLIVSRVYPDKDELLIAYGSHGSASVRRGHVARRDTDGKELERLEHTGSWPSALIDQLEEFAERIRSGDHGGEIELRYLEQAALVEAAYESARNKRAENPRDVLRRMLEA